MKSRFLLCTVIVSGSMSWNTNGATLYLSNPTPDEDETSGSMTLVSGESGTMNIMLDTAAIDPYAVAFLFVFIDTPDAPCDVKVTEVAHGQAPPFEYAESYILPATLSYDCDDGEDNFTEYRLDFGDPTFDGGFPLGSATHLIDSLTLTHTGVATGTVEVFFESVRIPVAKGPAPNYPPFTTNDFCLGSGIPGFLNLGVGNYGTSCKDAFDITIIPEPAVLVLLAVGWLAVIGKPKNSTRIART